MTFDPITLEVLWQRLVSAADEAGAALLRSSFSTIVRESYDFACIVTDTRGRSMAQASESIPSFIGTLPRTVKHVLQHFPLESFEPGDVIVTNDPWMGTGHLPDLSLIKPIFVGQRVIGLVATTAHAPDMGGKTGSADVRDVFEEGLQVPMMKLLSAGEPNQTLIAMIRANTRVPDQVMGDVWAQISALRIVEQRTLDLVAEYGMTNLDDLADEIIRRTERAMREAIASFPDGSYDYQIQADGVDQPLTLKVKIDVEGDQVRVDYTGSSDQVDRGINVALCYTASQTAYALKCLFSPTLPNNEGALLPISVSAPVGSILNHTYPASGQSRTLVGHFLPFLIFGAFADVAPDLIISGSGSPLWSMQVTGQSENGVTFVNKIFFNGGVGATHVKDGYACLSWPSNVSNVPIEMTEQQSPLRYQYKRIRPSSGGAGRYRGGLGQEVMLRHEGERPVIVGFHAERTQTPAPGVCGGQSGTTGILEINGRPLTPAEQKRQHRIMPGDEIRLATPGGGGFGDASGRDPALTERDRALGYVV
ncbi:MAG: hydantoinase B/oxoprolinase family protein [Pigmentiphaga sp.]|nr:hydantoinase B/oxoprolinase family protein [Pigmentiphaga sp.]